MNAVLFYVIPFSELCEQSMDIMLTPEMIEAEFPMLDYRDTKKEK